ncbi:MAG: hypothetical protein AAGA99_26270 [Actinomycetota bacterium]
MKLSRLLSILDQIELDLDEITGTIHPEGRDIAVSRIEHAHGVAADMRPGLRSPALDPTDRGRQPTTVDPETGEEVRVELTSVEAQVASRPPRDWSRDLAGALRRVERATGELRGIVAELTAPVETQDVDKAGLDVVHDGRQLRPACRWHLRIDAVYAAPRHDASKILDEITSRTMVCQPCATFADTHGRPPNLNELKHRETKGGWPRVHRRDAAS